MSVYYFIYAIVSLILVVFLVRHFVTRRNSLPSRLFVQGLHAENNGNYEEAAMTYESALVEIKKARFNSVLQKKILEKLKVLHMVIAYQNDQSFTRTNKHR